MIEVISKIFGYTAIILTGVICGFFIVMNMVKQEERRNERNNDKTKR